MLYVCDRKGEYTEAPKEVVLKEALKVSKKVFSSKKQIMSKETAIQAIGAQLCGLENEVIGCLFLNAPHKVLGWEILFHGSVNKSYAYPRVVVQKALQYNAAAIILAHNHPSGAIKPSRQDLALTGTLLQALEVIDVVVLDHLIVGDEIYSFADNGHIAKIRQRVSSNIWNGEM